jgi:hypothetical protein
VLIKHQHVGAFWNTFTTAGTANAKSNAVQRILADLHFLFQSVTKAIYLFVLLWNHAECTKD